jgi:hypothetical protein
MEVLRQDDWTQEVTTRLRSFEKSLIIALKEKGWDGKESEETVTWSFAGGLFYSITVITTIGTSLYIFAFVRLRVIASNVPSRVNSLIFRLWPYCTQNRHC